MVLLTTTDLDQRTRVQLLHMTASAAMATDAVKEGWGVANAYSGQLIKSSGHYISSDLTWFDRFLDGNPHDPLMLHLRNSSAGTHITPLEAQPFVFEDSKVIGGEHRFVGMHNGTINGSYRAKSFEQGSPNSDTYRTFHRLKTLMEGKERFSALLIEEWLSLFDDTSSFAFVMSFNNDLVIMRNKAKDLYSVRVNNGYLMCTSEDALKFTRGSAALFGINIVWGPVIKVAEDKLFHITPGQHEVEEESLHIIMEESKTYVYGVSSGDSSYYQKNWQTNVTPAVPAAPRGTFTPPVKAAKTNTAAFLDNDDDATDLDDEDTREWEMLYQRAYESGTNATTAIVPVNSPKAATNSAVSVEQIVANIKTKMNPMRERLAVLHIQQAMQGEFDTNYHGTICAPELLKNMPPEMLFNFYKEGDLLTKPQRVILNTFNYKVPATAEISIIEKYFGNILPHNLPPLVAESIIESIKV